MRKIQKAFTLVELLVTLSVVAIVIAIAAPSFNQQIAKNRAEVLGDNFASAINLARYEAIKRSGRVSICASNNGIACVGTWFDGYMIFVDGAADTAPAPAVVGPPIQYWVNPDSQTVMTVLRGLNPATFFRFNHLGTLARIDGNPITITISPQGCVANSNFAKLITVGLSGIVSVVERFPCP